MLSVITINLNNKIGLVKTADSAASQTFENFEYLIIDGGSTDGSSEVLQKLNANHFVSEQDRGFYDAMDKGIDAAKGEWLMFLNSGDYLLDENVLASANHKMTRNDADVLWRHRN